MIPREARPLITGLSLENFRAFGARTFIPSAPVTLLFGKNSVGKTAALSALQLLHQSYRGANDGPALKTDLSDGLTRLGSPRDYFHRHDWTQPLRIGVGLRERGVDYEIEWTFQAESARGGVTASSLVVKCSRGFDIKFLRARAPGKRKQTGMETARQRDARNTFSVDRKHSRVAQEAMNRMAIEIIRDPLLWKQITRTLPPSIPPDVKSLSKKLRDDQLRARVIVERLRVHPYPRNLYPRNSRNQPRITELIPNEACGRFLHSDEGHLAFFDVENEVSYAAHLCERIMGSLQSVGPVRAHPSDIPRFVDDTSASPTDNRTDLRNPNVLALKPALLRQTNEWLRRLEVPYELFTRSLDLDMRELRLRDLRRQGVEVGFSDVGFGISQLLPVVCQLLLNKNAVITVEQPELHVHPALQAEMGELFVYSALVLGNQLIVETHSEHLALRLQRCVRHRHQGISRDTFSLVYLDAPNAATTAQPLPLGNAGELTVTPPQGWFLERLHELMPKDA